MPNLTQLRIAAREIFNETLRAVDARAAVWRAVRLEDSRLIVCDATIDIGDQKVYSIAIGKAAFAMAAALNEILGEKLTAGITTSNAAWYRTGSGPGSPGGQPAWGGGCDRVNLASKWRAFQGGHPEPNDESLAAAQACFDLLQRADQEGAIVIFLISGGGSAMIEWPINEDISLSDLRAANKALINCGASITEINAARRAFSAVKGGRLAARAPHCDQITLIVSDVPPGEERNVASGPTLAPPRDAPDARQVIARYDLRSQLPETILRVIDTETDASKLFSDSGLTRKHFVLLDNRSELDAAAEAAGRRGFIIEISRDISDQSIEEGCSLLVAHLDHLRACATDEESRSNAENSVCLISGGEFACPVRGDGVGGRNLETALRLACATSQKPGTEHFVALCVGTDGIDGNSPAAGAIVDSTTIGRARAIGLDPQDFLDRSDAYSFFVALGDAVATGPTGTNVRDIRILLASA
ncbi:MAG TPA: DUF4147 domain-containing protein [Pyrinomonadaceae bacterium]|nr:DUF4147 domain-containing protein [Pyrinomonadaceae bacterium]